MDPSLEEGATIITNMIAIVPNGCFVINLAEKEYFYSIADAFNTVSASTQYYDKYTIITIFMDEFYLNLLPFDDTVEDNEKLKANKYFLSSYFNSIDSTEKAEIIHILSKYIGNYVYITSKMVNSYYSMIIWKNTIYKSKSSLPNDYAMYNKI